LAPAPSPEDELFRATFARGTAAYVQRRYAEAVDAFRECVQMRPNDQAAGLMLGRALRGLDL
jgi:Flp pilus assembly protein TadD